MAAPTTTTAMAKATTRKRFRLGRPVPSPWPDACEAVHCCKQKKTHTESKWVWPIGLAQMANKAEHARKREGKERERENERERARTRERTREREREANEWANEWANECANGLLTWCTKDAGAVGSPWSCEFWPRSFRPSRCF